MIRSRHHAEERAERDTALRRAARRRLERISAEIDAVTARRVSAWGDLARRPSRATAFQIKALSDRLTSLWSEARVARACIRYGERGLILERAHGEIGARQRRAV
jgi:hypothetical protein